MLPQTALLLRVLFEQLLAQPSSSPTQSWLPCSPAASLPSTSEDAMPTHQGSISAVEEFVLDAVKGKNAVAQFAHTAVAETAYPVKQLSSLSMASCSRPFAV